jgi:nucleotide-binding universal stress UspA family protein
MKNILLLTDFSDLSGFAKSLADKVANNTEATLHILKIVDLPSELNIDKEGNLLEEGADEISAYKKEKENAENQITEWTKDLQATHIDKVQYGRILDSTHDYIQSNKIDLVIMGTHGVTGIQELLSGSITEHVIKQNNIPVLSLKCDREDIDFSDFLVTGDFGADEVENLDTLKQLQKVFDSNIHLLWVNTKKEFISTAHAMDKMRSFAKVNAIEKVHYHIYNDDSVEEGIVNFANNYDASHEFQIDIIAVEKKNKTQLGYLFTGCQAIDIVNHVFKPILTYSKKN